MVAITIAVSIFFGLFGFIIIWALLKITKDQDELFKDKNSKDE